MIKVADLQEFMPHRPPMVWIDEIVSASPEGGECRLTLRADGLYMGPDGLRPTSYIEFIAQAFGYIAAADVRAGSGGAALKRAFLVAVKNAEFFETKPLGAGEEIRVVIQGARALGPITMFEGLVKSGDSLLGKAHLRVFGEA